MTSAYVALAVKEEKAGSSTKKPNLLQSAAAAPITGLQKLLEGLGDLLDDVVVILKQAVDKILNLVLKLLKDLNISIKDVTNTLKCLVEWPFDFAKCF